MIPLNYHQLYYFWTVAKIGSFSRATERLLLAQSTLSTQLKQLEGSLGVRLLNRDRHGVTLTNEGRGVFERCERIFSEGDALAEMLREGTPRAAPKLRLGVQESISAFLVLQLISFAETLDADVKVTVVGGLQSDLQNRLRKHELDLLIANFDYSVVLGHDYASRRIAQIPISFVAAPVVKRKFRNFPHDLEKIPLLIRTTENPIRREVDAFLRERGVVPKIDAEIDNPLLIRQLALMGKGAAVLDTLTVEEDLKRKRLVKLHSRPIGLIESVWFLYNARAKPNPRLRRIVDGLIGDFQFAY